MTSCPSRVRSSSSASSLIASGVRSASRAASSSSCSFLNHARLFTRRRTGASFGAFFFHAAAQRFLSACSGPTSKRNRTEWRETATLKWQCFLYPRASGLNATHVSSGGFTVRRACLATCANTSPPSERLSAGARLLPSASSLGRTRLRISAMRGWKPFASKTLKSPVTKAEDGIGVLLGQVRNRRAGRSGGASPPAPRQTSRQRTAQSLLASGSYYKGSGRACKRTRKEIVMFHNLREGGVVRQLAPGITARVFP